MNNKKRSLAVLLALALVLAIVGCGTKADNDGGSSEPGSSNPAAGQDKVTLEYYTWTDEADYMQKVVDAFNAQNDDIVVKLNTISNKNNEYNTKLMVSLSGGSQVDVYSMNGTNGLGLYASKQQLVDLTDRIKQENLDIGAYGPSLQDVVGILTEDKYYGLPYRTSQYALFYNKAIFDKEGIDFPQQMTWEEYAELAKRLTKGEGADKQWGGYLADWITAPLSALQKGSTILDDNLDDVKEWLNLQDRLYYQDASHMSYKQMKAESIDWIKQFESGNVAMLVNGEWTLNMLKGDIADGKTDIDFDITLMPQPAGANDPTSVGGVSAFMGINPASKHQDAAFKFVAFATGEQGGAILADSSVLPAYSNDKTKEAFLKATGIQGSGAFFEAKTVMQYPPIPEIDQINTAFNEQRDLFLFQEQDADKTIQKYVDQRKSILGK